MRLDPEIERRCAAFAERHFGYLPRTTALGLGHTDETLEARVANGTFDHPAASLFRYAGASRCWRGDIYAAVAAGPTEAVASHMSAAALFGLCPPPRVPHVLVPYGANTRIGGANVHRSTLRPAERTRVGVIPTTTAARAVVDCAALLGSNALCELVDVGLTSGALRIETLHAAIGRLSVPAGRRGIPRLLAALSVWAPGIEHDSVAEARLFRFVEAWGFARPVPLYVIRDASGTPVCETDAAWPDVLVALDYDSPRHHGPRRWPRDEDRHGAAKALGWTFVSVDKTDLMPGGQARFRTELETLLRAPPARR